MVLVERNASVPVTPRSASSASAAGPTKSPHTLSRGKVARSTRIVTKPWAASRAAAGPPPTTTASQSCADAAPVRAGRAECAALALVVLDATYRKPAEADMLFLP